jgi:hypothetical protein
MADLSPKMKAHGERIVAAVKAYVARAIDKRVGDLEAKLTEAKSSLASFERRASRHAEHLARLESRLKSLEHR